MAPHEIRRIRGSLSRPQFARLLGVTPLTVLRWELPDDNKEARRPRPKMIEALLELAAGRERTAASEPGSPEDADTATLAVEASVLQRAERAGEGGDDPRLPP